LAHHVRDEALFEAVCWLWGGASTKHLFDCRERVHFLAARSAVKNVSPNGSVFVAW
jgi:hypothetical protein